MAYFSLKSSSLFFIQNHGDLVSLHSYKGLCPVVFNVGNGFHCLHRSDSTQSTDHIAKFFIRNFKIYVAKLKIQTRMHSSRMRTGRSLTVCCSHLPGGVGSPCQGSLPAGGVSAWSGGFLLGLGGCLPGLGGFSLLGRLPGPGGSAWSRGVYLVPGGVCLVGGGFLPALGCLPGPRGGSLETPL